MPLTLSSENLEIKPAQTLRESVVDGYGLSFNEKEQLKYKGLMMAQQAKQVIKP